MISLRFTCKECGLEDEIVTCRHREPTEDLIEWMKLTVGLAVQHVHLAKSHAKNGFKCKSLNMSTVKIPFDKDNPNCYIGMQTDTIPPIGDPKKTE